MTVSIFLAILEIWSGEECINITATLFSSGLGWLIDIHDVNVLKKAIGIH
jgi:hypothetical protein